MSKSREHHYVPQFYLRHFSKDGKRICLLNLRRSKLVPGASIKHQCSRRNFYDYNSGLEDALGSFEGEVAPILKVILAKSALPSRLTSDHMKLLTFIVVQRSRGMQAANASDAMVDTVAKITLEGHPELKKIDLNKFEVRSPHPAALPLGVVPEAARVASDLHMHLFLNNTGTDFITSDEPIVLHNQFCEGINYQGVCGWGCSGLQVFWPASPRVLLFLYDGQVYAVGSRRRQPVTVISEDDDVEQLNAFQILNAENNIYISDTSQAQHFQRQAASLMPKRPKRRIITVRTERIPDGKGESQLIHFYEPLLPCKLCLSHVNIRRSMRRIPLDMRAKMHRSQPLRSAQRRGEPNQRGVKYPVKTEK